MVLAEAGDGAETGGVLAANTRKAMYSCGPRAMRLEDPFPVTAPSTGWPTPATRSSSKTPATGKGRLHTGHRWAAKEVIDRKITP